MVAGSVIGVSSVSAGSSQARFVAS
jgi:hypothetical protein